MSELDALLAPISSERPCGDDLSFSAAYDRIQEARRSDDPTLEQGEWVTELKSADWPAVLQQSSELLRQRSKDLQLAVWFTEAAARTRGFSGLALGFRLVAGLCDTFWDDVYPAIDDGDAEQRIGNLGWLLTHSTAWMNEIPLVRNPLGEFGHIHFEIARNRQKDPGAQAAANDGLPPLDALEGARRSASHDHYRALLDTLPDCQQALATLEAAVDARLGSDGPSFSAARERLAFLSDVVTRFAREAGMFLDATAGTVGATEMPVADTTEVATHSLDSTPATGPVQSRKEALLQLRRVAEFFRRTEPHSPVAYLADKAARWGEMPLHEWLRRVIKDDSTLSQLQELLDVAADDPGRDVVS